MVQTHRTVITQYLPCEMRSESFPLKTNKGSGKKVGEEFSFYVEEKQIPETRFLQSSDCDIKKLVANAVPESTRKTTKCAVNVFEGEERFEQTLEI